MLSALMSFFIEQVAKQRKSLFLWAPVAMGLGIITYFKADLDLSWWALGMASFFVVLALSKSVHSYSKTGQNRWLGCVFVSLALGLFVLGYASAFHRT